MAQETNETSVQAKYFVGDAEAAAITAPNKEVDVPIELAAAAASPASSSHLFAKPLIPRARQESASSIIDGGTQQSHVGLLNRVVSFFLYSKLRALSCSLRANHGLSVIGIKQSC